MGAGHNEFTLYVALLRCTCSPMYDLGLVESIRQSAKLLLVKPFGLLVSFSSTVDIVNGETVKLLSA